MRVPGYAALFGAAALLSLVTVPASRSLSLRLGAVDRGGGRRAHEGDVPRLGGLGIYLVWAAITAVAIGLGDEPAQARRMLGILAGSFALLAVGWYDDLRSASVLAKLTVQVLAALAAFYCGVRLEVLSNPAGETLRLGWMELPVTVLWLVVVTNAFNLIDGIDGLAATTGITLCAGMVLLYVGTDWLGPAGIVALAGALAGFLRYNFPPARIFMGDSGSQSVGFLLGAFALLSFAKATTLAALALPLVVFGHPLVDLAYAVLRRYHRGQSLGVADREHLHHKLLDRGYSRRKTLAILAVLNVVLLGLVVYLANRRLPGVVVLLAMLVVPSGIGWRIARHILAGGSVRDEALTFFKNRERRRMLYQGKLFRRAALAAAGEGELLGFVRAFVADTGLDGVRVHLRLPREEGVVLFDDGVPEASSRLAVSVSVVRPDRDFQLLEVGVNRDDERGGCPADAAGALADGFRSFLERVARNVGTGRVFVDTASNRIL